MVAEGTCAWLCSGTGSTLPALKFARNYSDMFEVKKELVSTKASRWLVCSLRSCHSCSRGPLASIQTPIHYQQDFSPDHVLPSLQPNYKFTTRSCRCIDSCDLTHCCNSTRRSKSPKKIYQDSDVRKGLVPLRPFKVQDRWQRSCTLNSGTKKERHGYSKQITLRICSVDP